MSPSSSSSSSRPPFSSPSSSSDLAVPSRRNFPRLAAWKSTMPLKRHKPSARDTKFKKRCNDVNRHFSPSMDTVLPSVETDDFLDLTCNFSSQRDQETNLSDAATSAAHSCNNIEAYGVIDPKLCGVEQATGSATSNSAERQLSPAFNSATEVSSSSQDYSVYSSKQEHEAPVASMVDSSKALVTHGIEANTSTTNPNPPMIPQVKRSYSVVAIGKLHRGKRLNGKYDPDNHEIMRLRQEHDLDFQDIASILNEERRKEGRRDDLTDNAVYSRYTRNAPLIAQMRNEKFIPTAKDNHYTKMKFPKVQPITGFDSREDNLLDVATQHVQAQFWAPVSKRIEELGGQYHDADTCERRFECL